MLRNVVKSMLGFGGGARRRAEEAHNEHQAAQQAAPIPKTKPASPRKETTAVPAPTTAAAVNISKPPRPPQSTQALPITVAETIPQRSVKISFPKGHIRANLTEADVAKAAELFGTVVQVGMKDKCAVVLFARAAEAVKCCASFEDLQDALPTTLGYAASKLRIKYMGGSSSLDDSYASFDVSVSTTRTEAPSFSALDQTKVWDLENEAHHLLDESIQVPTSAVQEGNEVNTMATVEETAPSTAEVAAPSVQGLGDGSFKRTRTESNVSSQSDSASRALSSNDADDQMSQHEGVWDSADREGGRWKTANSAPASSAALAPHYNHQSPQLTTQRSLSIDVHSTEEDVEDEIVVGRSSRSQSQSPPIALLKKPSREIQVGSPKSNQVETEQEADILPLAPEAVNEVLPVVAPSVDDDGDDTDEMLEEVESSPSEDWESSEKDEMDSSSKKVSSIDVLQQNLRISTSNRSVVIPSTVGRLPAKAPRGASTQSSLTANPLQAELELLRRNHSQLQDKYSEAVSRMRILEAEAKVRSRERVEFEEEMRECEDHWSQELTELEARKAELENEASGLKEANRRSRIEIARISGELSAAKAAREAAEALLESSKAKAERDSLSTVLALQRLVTVLDKQKESALSSLKVYKEELVQLRELHKAAVAESLELKERVAAQVHRVSRAPTDAVMTRKPASVGFEVSAEESESYPEAESKVDEGTEDEEKVAEATSLRDTVKQEMEKYLQLVHSPDHPDVTSESSPPSYSLPTVETNPKLSFIMSEARARTTSERIALDLAESRRKLESLRLDVPSSSRRQRF